MSATPKFRTGDWVGYVVLLDGDEIGRVESRREYYNLHPRPATYTVWLAYSPDDGLLTRHGSTDFFSTRREAAAALVARHTDRGEA